MTPEQIKAYEIYKASGTTQGMPPLVAVATVQVDEPSSWATVNLSPYLDGSYVRPKPTMLTRGDEVSLLYPGLVHSVHGESESGKSLIIQIEVAALLNAGLDVLFIDFEMDAGEVTDRLLTFGAGRKQILEHFHYVRPDTDPSTGQPLADWHRLLNKRYALAVIDGVTDALSTVGAVQTNDQDGVTAWMRAFPKNIANRTGAAVVLIDHVTKDADSRGRFAIGAQAKMSGLTGAAYLVEVVEPLGLGLRGVVVLRVGKDRHGAVRRHCGPFRKGDRTQEAARIVVDSRDPDNPVVTIEPPRSSDDKQATFRPTALMERVSRVVEINPRCSKRAILTAVKGKEQYIGDAIALLISEEYVTVEDGPNRSQLHTSTQAYRQADDPASDSYQDPGDTGSPNQVSSVSRPYTGGRETHTGLSPETPGRHPGDTAKPWPKCTECGNDIYTHNGRSLCAGCLKESSA